MIRTASVKDANFTSVALGGVTVFFPTALKLTVFPLLAMFFMVIGHFAPLQYFNAGELVAESVVTVLYGKNKPLMLLI